MKKPSSRSVHHQGEEVAQKSNPPKVCFVLLVLRGSLGSCDQLNFERGLTRNWRGGDSHPHSIPPAAEKTEPGGPRRRCAERHRTIEIKSNASSLMISEISPARPIARVPWSSSSRRNDRHARRHRIWILETLPCFAAASNTVRGSVSSTECDPREELRSRHREFLL